MYPFLIQNVPILAFSAVDNNNLLSVLKILWSQKRSVTVGMNSLSLIRLNVTQPIRMSI